MGKSKYRRSYVDKKGRGRYQNCGGYNEVTILAKGMFSAGGTSELDQHNLAKPGPNTAAARTLRAVKKELNW